MMVDMMPILHNMIMMIKAYVNRSWSLKMIYEFPFLLTMIFEIKYVKLLCSFWNCIETSLEVA